MNFSANRLRWIALLLITFNFIANLANDIYLPSMPDLTDVFNTTTSTLQFTMSAWFAGVALPQLFFGPLSERIGRRPILLGGGVCFILATLLAGFALNIEMLIVGRFFQGLGVCCLNVASISIFADLYDNQHRKRIINKLNIVGSLSLLLGPIIGGYLFIYYGWRSNFVFVFTLGFLNLIALWLSLPESHQKLNPQALHKKILWDNYVALIKDKNFIGNITPYCLLLGGLIAYLTAAPFIVIDILKTPPELFGYTQLPIVGTYIASTSLLIRLERYCKNCNFTMIGMILAVLSCLLVLLIDNVMTLTLGLFIASMTVYAIGFGLCAATLVTDALASSNQRIGSAAALLGCGMATACLCSSTLIGIFYKETVTSFAVPLLLISTMAFLIFAKNKLRQTVLAK